ncbi:PQQ-binding-like beta-propeller repeat protein [Halorubrum sp. JWXQ-INN 858]|uniref:outer membrane protein assembly factor BamB family protein n=1 Tax=Halorubrum sp. JWXQ-INN 858 TaxID=2690782 RepID=UPI001359976A|nr:PQQ-binding-like beta-propeller repeat protein [Halorubrum sp. JWXQ-INN 858]MWV65381.1 PQQ-binding-like beta-propeller repeat protein [Halorubrum sp. JWXQ-INN 858]
MDDPSPRIGRALPLLIAFAFVLAVAGTTALSVSGGPAIGGSAIGAASDDGSWPMEGHDPGQTAFDPDAAGPDGDVGPGWISVTGYGPGVTVANGRAFVAGGERRGVVTAYDAADGTREWRAQVGDAVSSKPIVDGDTVYVHVSEQRGRDVVEDHHEVVALDAGTGDVEWRFAAAADRYGYTVFSWKTLTAADGRLYIAGENYDDRWGADEAGFVMSIDEDGTERWRTDIGSHGIARPAVTDGTVVTTVERFGGRDRVRALDAGNGSDRWHTSHPGGHDLSAPAVHDGTAYVNARSPLAIDAETGAVTTMFDAPGTSRQPLAVTDDRLLVPGGPSRDRGPTQLHAVDREVGDVEWSAGSSTGFSSRPIASETTVFVGAWDGVMYAFDRETGEERWTYEVNADYAITNEPAVVGETLYVGPVDDRVYALVDGGTARDPAALVTLSRYLSAIGDLAGVYAVISLVYLGVGVPFGVLGGIALFGVVTGFRLSRTPLRLLAARLFGTPPSEVTRRREFAAALTASVACVLMIGLVCTVTFGTFPFNGLIAALAVAAGSWAVLTRRWLPDHALDLDADADVIARQWGVLLALYGLVVGLAYPLVVFVIVLGIYFT